MKIYKNGVSSINLGGVDYHADDEGIIDVPDQAVNQRVWAAGWVVAKGRIAELKQDKPIINETPLPEASPVVEAASTENLEETKKDIDPPEEPPAKPSTTKKPLLPK